MLGGKSETVLQIEPGAPYNLRICASCALGDPHVAIITALVSSSFTCVLKTNASLSSQESRSGYSGTMFAYNSGI